MGNSFSLTDLCGCPDPCADCCGCGCAGIDSSTVLYATVSTCSGSIALNWDSGLSAWTGTDAGCGPGGTTITVSCIGNTGTCNDYAVSISVGDDSDCAITNLAFVSCTCSPFNLVWGFTATGSCFTTISSITITT